MSRVLLMSHSTTTAFLKKRAHSTDNQINTLVNHVFEGFPDGFHNPVDGRPRILSRYNAELLVIAIDMHKQGMSPKAISAVVNNPQTSRAHATRRRLLILESSGNVSFHDAIDEELAKAMEEQGSYPLVIVNLHSVKARVAAAIADASPVAQPKNLSEFKAKVAAFQKRQKAAKKERV